MGDRMGAASGWGQRMGLVYGWRGGQAGWDGCGGWVGGGEGNMLRTPALGRAVEVAGGPAGRGRMAAAPRALSCCLGPRRRSRFRVQLRPSGAQGSRSVAAAGVLVAVLGVGVVGVAVGAPVAGGGVRLAGVAVLDGAQGAGTGLWGGGEEGGRGGGGGAGASARCPRNDYLCEPRLPLKVQSNRSAGCACAAWHVADGTTKDVPFTVRDPAAAHAAKGAAQRAPGCPAPTVRSRRRGRCRRWCMQRGRPHRGCSTLRRRACRRRRPGCSLGGGGGGEGRGAGWGEGGEAG